MSELAQHGPNWSSLVEPTVNFLLYAFLGRYLYRKYVPQLLKARSIQIAKDLAGAAADLSAAVEDLEVKRRRLEHIDEEKRELDERFRIEAQNIAHSIADETRRKAERIARDVERQIESELAAALKALRQETVAAAAQLARKKLKSELSAEEDRRLRREVFDAAAWQQAGLGS